jgi:hypothetical protein
VLGESLGVFDILIARQSAVYRLPHEVGQQSLHVHSALVGQVLFDELAEAQPFIQLPHQEPAAVGGHSRPLEVHLQPAIERELKWPILCLTHPPRRPGRVQTHVYQGLYTILPISSPPENGNPG